MLLEAVAVGAAAEEVVAFGVGKMDPPPNNASREEVTGGRHARARGGGGILADEVLLAVKIEETNDAW